MSLKNYINRELYQPLRSILGIKPKWYYRDLKELINQKEKSNNVEFDNLIVHPQLKDKFDSAGTMSGHYFHQDLYIAQRIFEKNPKKHLDIGSRIDGFVAHIAAFRKIDIVDIRDINSNVKNISFKKMDLTAQIDVKNDFKYDSISILHAIEHFGLGRYGDPINYYGHIVALKNISKLLTKDGNLYISVPIGPQRLEFNAHRVFALDYLLKWFSSENFEVKDFSYIDDNGDFHPYMQLSDLDLSNNLGCHYGCGVFTLNFKNE